MRINGQPTLDSTFKRGEAIPSKTQLPFASIGAITATSRQCKFFPTMSLRYFSQYPLYRATKLAFFIFAYTSDYNVSTRRTLRNCKTPMRLSLPQGFVRPLSTTVFRFYYFTTLLRFRNFRLNCSCYAILQ